MPLKIMGGRIPIPHFSWEINTDLNAEEKLFETAAAIWWAIRWVEPKWCWARVNYLTVVLSAKNLWSHLHYILQWASVPTPESHLFSTDRQMYIRHPFGVWAVIQWSAMIGVSEVMAFAAPVSGLDYRKHLLVCKQVASSIYVIQKMFVMLFGHILI